MDRGLTTTMPYSIIARQATKHRLAKVREIALDGMPDIGELALDQTLDAAAHSMLVEFRQHGPYNHMSMHIMVRLTNDRE